MMNDVALRVGVIGAGTMGGILIRRLSTHTQIGEIRVADPHPRNRKKLDRYVQEWYGDEYTELLRRSDMLLLAVKPQIFPAIASRLMDAVRPDQTVISIMAGIPLRELAHALKLTEIARVMPNIAARNGHAAVGISFSFDSSDAFCASVQSIMRTLGSVYVIPEHSFDVFTALSGSGIAFALRVIEGLTLAGIDGGLDADIAEEIATQVCRGAATLLAKSPRANAAQLIREICSAGGTTIAGIAALEKGALNAALIDAVRAAIARAEKIKTDHLH